MDPLAICGIVRCKILRFCASVMAFLQKGLPWLNFRTGALSHNIAPVNMQWVKSSTPINYTYKLSFQ